MGESSASCATRRVSAPWAQLLPGIPAFAPRIGRDSFTRVLHRRLMRKRKERHLGGLRIARVSRESRTRAKHLRCADELLGDRIQETRPLVRYAAGSVRRLEIRRRGRHAVRVHVPVPAVSGVVETADFSEITVRLVAEEAVVL